MAMAFSSVLPELVLLLSQFITVLSASDLIAQSVNMLTSRWVRFRICMLLPQCRLRFEGSFWRENAGKHVQ
jgi:hypothetical protein